MKILLLTTWLLSLSIAAICQQEKDTVLRSQLTNKLSYTKPSNNQASRKGISLEPLAGIGTSKAVQGGKNNLGWNAGCGVVFMFNDHWGISSGLQVERYSTEVVSGTDSLYINNAAGGGFWASNSVSANYKFTYIELPIILRYISSKYKKMGIFADAGFILSYLISANESRITNETDFDTSIYRNYSTPLESTYSVSLGSNVPKTNSINFEGHFSLGLIFPLNQNFSIITDLCISKGFTNVGNSSNDFVNLTDLFYYYNKNNNYTNPTIFNYGANFSALFSIHLNMKL
jgi:hypothetical protein